MGSRRGKVVKRERKGWEVGEERVGGQEWKGWELRRGKVKRETKGCEAEEERVRSGRGKGGEGRRGKVGKQKRKGCETGKERV